MLEKQSSSKFACHFLLFIFLFTRCLLDNLVNCTDSRVLGRWCAIKVSQVHYLTCLIQIWLLRGGTRSCCCHLPCLCEQHAYELTFLQDYWTATTMKGLKPVTFCPKLVKGSKLDAMLPLNFQANLLLSW